jgi:broad specificity phosphatase PhoE
MPQLGHALHGGFAGLFKWDMATRVCIVEAAPTGWDVDGRICGDVSLPLQGEALDAMRRLVETIPDAIASVYRPAENEACEQTARFICQKFNLRARNSPELQEPNLGLWQGLTSEELKSRFPTVFPQWLEQPLIVTPPDAEPLSEAISRIADGLDRILRRNRDLSVALALRPMAMQIAAGILRSEPHQTIAGHLHRRDSMTTIDVEPRSFRAA